MKANNSITQSQPVRKSFTATISGDAVQRMINTALHDPRRAASFTSTLISVVNSNKKLQECEPASIISAALRGEAMNLSLALGQFSVVPYGTSANYQLSYKGLAQLATRSGQYRDFGVFDVRQGEYLGADKRTRQPIIEWKDDDERENLPLEGFYGFYELQNGFCKSIYWSHEKILNHANRYSKAFSKAKYEAMLSGKMDQREVEKLRFGSPWYDEPLSEAHMKMCKKTVLIQMLGDGTAPLSLEMTSAIKEDQAVEQGGAFFAEDDPRIIAANRPASANAEETSVPVEAREVAHAPESTPAQAENPVPTPAPAPEPVSAPVPEPAPAPKAKAEPKKAEKPASRVDQVKSRIAGNDPDDFLGDPDPNDQLSFLTLN